MNRQGMGGVVFLNNVEGTFQSAVVPTIARYPRRDRTAGPCFWLTIFASATVATLLLDMRGFKLPMSLIYWFDPIAWLSNWAGLTPRFSGFFSGVDQGVADIARWLGRPIAFSFLFWFLAGCARWRHPSLVFLVWIVPCLVGMQFTTMRAYDALADRFHTEGRVDLEADALGKELFIIDHARPADPARPRLTARLAELQRDR
jgi:hypothetical protein